MPDLFFLPHLLFLLNFPLYLIILVFSQPIGQFSREPSFCQPLNIQRSLVSSLLPHLRIEVHVGDDLLISPCIDEQSFLLHLNADFSLHSGRLRNPFIGLRFPCVAKFMIGLLLIRLREGVPILDITVDILIPANERFLLVDSNDLDNLDPLISYIPLLILLDHRGLNMIVVVDAVDQFHIAVHDDLTGLE